MTDGFRHDEAFARSLDAGSPLAAFRGQFHIPASQDIARTAAKAGSPASPIGGECVYLVGNSLGLQPKGTRAALEQELDDWARLGVEGHFHAKHPWFPAHEFVRDSLARVVGALPREVVAMNSLTTNLHLLMVSFYRPTRERYKIVIEDAAFPSDSYAMLSQLEFHARLIERASGRAGFDPREGLIRLKPNGGGETLRTDDILSAIDREKGTIALLMLGGVNYRTGQLFDIAEITRFARERGVVVGWDLAHAAGNIDLRLHDWGPDFAAWCSYKYLNSGPGAIAGAFVHERHLDAARARSTGGEVGFARFAGWWGNDPKARFKMGPAFEPVASADAWQLSNPPILALSPLRASLEVFDRATMAGLRAKSRLMTGYLEFLIGELNTALAEKGKARVEILTPRDPKERGCQLSLRVQTGDARRPRDVHAALLAAGVVTDFREPDVIRAAPVPLYNSFHDVWRFAGVLQSLLQGGSEAN